MSLVCTSTYNDVDHLFRGANQQLAISLIELVNSFEAYWPMTLRGFYYQAVSHLLVPNNLSEYRRISKILAELRRADLVPWFLGLGLHRLAPGGVLAVLTSSAWLSIPTWRYLRRHLLTGETSWLAQPIDELMGREPKFVAQDVLVAEAEAVLKEYKIDQIAVLDEAHRPVGLLDVQDILDIRI